MKITQYQSLRKTSLPHSDGLKDNSINFPGPHESPCCVWICHKNDSESKEEKSNQKGASRILYCLFSTGLMQIACATPSAALAFLGGLGVDPTTINSWNDLIRAAKHSNKLLNGIQGGLAAFGLNYTMNLLFMEDSVVDFFNSIAECKSILLSLAGWALVASISNAQMGADGFSFAGVYKWIPFFLNWIQYFATRYNGAVLMKNWIKNYFYCSPNPHQGEILADRLTAFFKFNTVKGQNIIQLKNTNPKDFNQQEKRAITIAIYQLALEAGFDQDRSTQWTWYNSITRFVGSLPGIGYFGTLAATASRAFSSIADWVGYYFSPASSVSLGGGAIAQIPSLGFAMKSNSAIFDQVYDFIITQCSNPKRYSNGRRLGWLVAASSSAYVSYYSSEGILAEGENVVFKGILLYLGLGSSVSKSVAAASFASVALINFFASMKLINKYLHKPNIDQKMVIDRESALFFLENCRRYTIDEDWLKNKIAPSQGPLL